LLIHMLSLYLLSAVPLVAGHGGILWPPTWQAGEGIPLEEITTYKVSSDPVVRDPNIRWKGITNIKAWLTDQAYLEGHGVDNAGLGVVTNPECTEDFKCGREKTPWASPGRAPSLGGGCGIFGGNPYGCPIGNDTRPPGSDCLNGGTWAFGSSALDVDFPQALTTEWVLGSNQEVAWGTNGNHWGGYTYRLCKMPAEGKTGITEECFAKNVLKFAAPYTIMRHMHKIGEWFRVDQNDLTVGTYPEGSAWRHIAKASNTYNGYLRKDTVVIPANLQVGEYVLSLRWDANGAQIWVSCANIRLMLPA